MMDIVTLLLLILLAILPMIPLLEKYRKNKKLYAGLESLPGDPWYPIVGTMWRFIKAGRKDFWKKFKERSLLYGPLFRSWNTTQPMLHMMKAEHFEIFLGNSENLQKSTGYKHLIPWLGEGLISVSDPHMWRKHRKLITPTFSFSILDNFSVVFSERAQLLADILLPKANGEIFDIWPMLSLCALDIICETAMGVKVNAMSNPDSDYVKAAATITAISVQQSMNPFLANDFLFSFTNTKKVKEKYIKIAHDFSKKVVQERRQQLDRESGKELSEELLLGQKKRVAFLDFLLKANDEKHVLTDDEIRQEVDTFMFAGHDTTTVSTAWMLFALANYPEVQKKVHQELDSVFEGRERPVTPQDLNQMKYLERALKETQRAFTVVPFMARKLQKDVVVDGRNIPAGVSAVMHLYDLHHDPEQFPEPDKFDPDRFLPENCAKRHPYSFVPFSAGPRNCLGQKFAMRNVKTMVACLLRKYRVTRALNTPENIECFADIVMKPQNGMQIALEPRKPR